MTFTPGDRVHLRGFGTGIVRELRSGGQYAIEIKGRLVVAAGRELERAAGAPKPRKETPTAKPAGESRGTPTTAGASPSRSLDLHGKTVDESLDVLEAFVNDALLAGCHEVRVIHGRSGGRVKTAVHRYLRRISSVVTFRVDPYNAGVTIVTFS
jgi:DNA mismatch repair protein MutS2